MSSTEGGKKGHDGCHLDVKGTIDRTPEQRWEDFKKEFDGRHLDVGGKDRFNPLDDLGKIWNDYKIQFGKTYKDSTEDEHRKKIFEETLEFIARHNERYAKREEAFTMGINQFTDLDLANGESPCGCSGRNKCAKK